MLGPGLVLILILLVVVVVGLLLLGLGVVKPKTLPKAPLRNPLTGRAAAEAEKQLGQDGR